MTEKINLELVFKRRKCLRMVDDERKTVPGDRANVRKGAHKTRLLLTCPNDYISAEDTPG